MSHTSDFVYGGIDGTITTFAIVAGAAGANLDPKIIVILGLANVFADGFSMAAGRYLSAKAEEDELGTPREPSPINSAIVTFLSFVGMGLIPLSAFIYGYLLQRSGDKDLYPYAYALTAMGLFFVGYVRGQMNGTDPVASGMQTLLIGGLAAVISFFIAQGLTRIG